MAALTPLAQASTGGTLYVNGSTGTDSGTCRLAAHPCATITYALTKSSTTATSTIDVAAGYYPEPLTITHSVSIVGAADSGSTATIIDPSTLVTDTDTDSSVPQDTIVDVTDTTGVTLKDLDITGSNAQSDFDSCADDFVGVYYHDSSGTMSTDQVTGIELPAGLFGCQDGLAVYVASDAGDTSSVAMTTLKVSSFQKNGVTCDDAGTTCSVAGSTITGVGANDQIAPNGFQGLDAASVTLSKDAIKDNSYTGGGSDNEATGVLIFDVGTVTVTGSTLGSNDVNGYFGSDGTGPQEGTWTISGNTVSSAADNVPGGAAGFGWGIQLDSTSNTVLISDNTVHGSKAYGIALTGVNGGATVSGNTVTGSGSDGIYVGGPGSAAGATDSLSNLIEDNTSSSNKGDGIHADTDSGYNTFSGNITKTNTTYDLEDGGNLNSWSGNACTPANDSSPAGLCD
jgi:parallel beta-helix repeat protein